MKNIQTTLMRYVALTLAIVPVAAGNVVTDWNAIASTTIVKNGGKAPGGAAVWFSYASLAVYDAVNAITGQYRPFHYYGSASRNASIDAAVAAAAHRVLVNYFPSQQTDLDAHFAASLSTIRPGDAGASLREEAAMLGIRFVKSQPTTYLLQYKGGRVKREGAGLSFFYYAPTTTLVSARS